MTAHIDPRLQKVLNALEVPWEITHGTRHYKLFVNGALAGILPKSKGKDDDRRAVLNSISQARRAAAGVPKRRMG